MTAHTHASPLDLLEAIATARTIRRYHFDPIPDQDLQRILWAATRAPSGTNRQPFRFVVLRDGERARRAKALLGDAFRRGWRHKAEQEKWGAAELSADSRRGRTIAAMQFFVDHFERIPVVVLPCFVRYRELSHHEGGSIYPACQNLFLAARALGYGACFSGWHLLVERELRELLEIPDGVELSLCITLGRPRGSHGPLRRRPLRESVFEDRWGAQALWAEDPPDSRFTRGGPPVPTSDE
jgi:nitroreductase